MSNAGQGTPELSWRPTVAIQTHGCKLNQADSDQLARRFAEAGYRIVPSGSPADVFVLNTCTVTRTADAKARQALRKAHRANPGTVVVATGCYAQRDRDQLASVDGVTLVAGNVEKEAIPVLVSEALRQRESNPTALAMDGPAPTAQIPAPRDNSGLLWPSPGRNRAMVKIQEGCDQVCAYCIVPKVRGRERSIEPETLVATINQRHSEGFHEVVLTGTQLGTYGFDLPGMNLTGLLKSLLDETAIPRIRVSSLQAQEIDEGLLDLWRDRRLCPHFHVPLQSGSGPVLKAMRRRYTTERFASALGLVRSYVEGAGITTDIIVGFPGEGYEEFKESRDFAKRMGFSDIHVFPFSPRPGTSAAFLDDSVPPEVKKERTAEMIEVGRQGAEQFRKAQLGRVRQVLWESAKRRNGETEWRGLTDNYIRVKTTSTEELRDRITGARLRELDGEFVAVQVV